MAKTFVMADIHGAYKAMLQCFEKSNFNYEEDILIQLGDITDGWPEVYECVEELLKIKNLISIRGNHDDWFCSFINLESHPAGWQQGGLGTIRSYLAHSSDTSRLNDIHKKFIAYGYHFKKSAPINKKDIPLTHQSFFNNQINYYCDNQKRLFVHGGYNRGFPVEQTYPDDYFWDRSLWEQARIIQGKKEKLKTFDNFEKIFIGHSRVNIGNNLEAKPMYAGNLVWNLDTGAGYSGKLTMMNVDTEEYWQSDFIPNLYPNERAR